MKKILVISLTAIVVATILSSGVIACEEPEQRGPAPGSNDSSPDGPCWEGDWVNEDKPGDNRGPAPNAGSGDHDGPGWPED